MTTFAVLATGPSMSAAIADSVRYRMPAVAVSDAFRLAPWANALVSHDPGWWEANPDARRFAGRKFCQRFAPGVEVLGRSPEFPPDCNSGLQGMRVAHLLGATRILLIGFDMRGSHFFGPHRPPLSNTTDERFRHHIAQFDRWTSCDVLNCTPRSALQRFPFADLREFLAAPGPFSGRPSVCGVNAQ